MCMWRLQVFEEKLIFGLNTKFVHLITGKVCSTRKKIQHLLKEMKYLFIYNKMTL